MSALEGLLRAVVEEPEAEDHWLVLADWLEEHDDPRRAELLRLTRRLLETCCEPDRHPDRAAWQARVLELLGQGVKPCVPQQTVPLAEGVAITFARVPPGSFLMGSPKDEPDRGTEERQHRVTLTRGYWLGIHPVTRGQWWAVRGGRRPREPDRPAEKVTWHQSAEFCKQLGKKTGRRFRLATEAEWERACRAGTTTAYVFGATIPQELANCGGPDLGRRGTTPVGSYPPNAFGLYDMHGNVWDWCADWHGAYSRARNTIDPTGPPTGATRILRGGSWHYHPWNCRSAFRGFNTPETVQVGGGCRVCLAE